MQDWGMSRSDIWSSFWKVCIQNDSFYQGYWSLIKQWYSFWSYWGSSTCTDYVMGANSIFQAIKTNPIWNANSYWYFFTSLVSFSSDNSWGYNFKYYDISTNSLQTFNVPSIAGFNYVLTNWQTVFFDEVYFWHDSIIFMNSESHYTLQLLGTTLLENLVLYGDPFSNWDNLYLIDFNLWKAWSTNLSWDYVASIMLNAIDISNNLLFNEINWTNSYSLSAWSTSVFPLTAWNLCSWDWCKQSNWGYSSNMWSYNLDLDFVAPDYSNQFPWGNPRLEWSITQQESVEAYNSCIDRYINVKDLSSFWFQCRQDYENNKLTRDQYLAIENYVLDLDSNTAFSWSTVTDNCFLMSDIALNMFDTHSWTYNTDVNLAWRGSSSTAWIDLSYMCWSKPSVTPSEDWINWWQDLLNRIWLWSSITSWWYSVFDTAISEFKDMISDPFNEYIIDPIQSEYNSWYAKASPVACVTTNNTFTYWDYILYFGAVILVLVLYWFFF